MFCDTLETILVETGSQLVAGDGLTSCHITRKCDNPNGILKE